MLEVDEKLLVEWFRPIFYNTIFTFLELTFNDFLNSII
jgi:hypothetical protein